MEERSVGDKNAKGMDEWMEEIELLRHERTSCDFQWTFTPVKLKKNHFRLNVLGAALNSSIRKFILGSVSATVYIDYVNYENSVDSVSRNNVLYRPLSILSYTMASSHQCASQSDHYLRN
jgi:hypothetical protein